MEERLPEFIQEREGILKPDKSIDKKDKKVDITISRVKTSIDPAHFNSFKIYGDASR